MESLIYIAVFAVILAVSFIVVSKLKKKPEQSSKESGSAKGTSAKANGKAEPTSAKAVDPIYGPVQIFFASQTGNAQNLAKTLGQEAIQQGFVPEIIDLGTNPIEELKKSKLAVFTVSTYGEGEPPESCKPFDEWMISADRPADELSGMKFTVFALGNKQYQFYCEQGRKTDKHLERMGGQRVYRLGEGDDNESLEDDFNTWKEQLWDELKKYASALQAESGLKIKRQPSKAPEGLAFNLVFKQDEKEVDVIHYDNKNDGKTYNFQAKQYLASNSAKVTFSRELRQKTDDGSTLHVEIDISTTGLNYITAQNLALYPENTSDFVEKAARVFGVELDSVFALEEKADNEGRVKFEHPFPTPISVRTYLTKFCDLQGPIKKKQLKELAQFCENPDHQKQLLLLASPEGKTEFDIQIHSRLKGLLDIIEDFNIKIPFENLVNIAAPILPRHYTIASSSKKDPQSVHLCVSVYADRRSDAPIKYGLTSAFLTGYHEELRKGNQVPDVKVSVINSTFVLPTDAGVPIIMVGPGAGIAPFRGFIEEKVHLVENNLENPYGEMTLFFGCRGCDWDYLYKEELNKLYESKLLENYYVAFSRERDRKIYVQDLIEEEKKTVTKILLEQNGVLYLCGSMAMGKAVIKRLAEIVSLYYNISLNEGEQKIIEMEKQKKINKELWG